MPNLGLALELSPQQLTDALHFLVSVGLIKEVKGRYLPGTSRIFLGNDSPMIHGGSDLEPGHFHRFNADMGTTNNAFDAARLG